MIDIRLSTSSMPRGTRGLPHGAYSRPVDPGALLPGTHRAENEPPTQGVNQLVSSSVLTAPARPYLAPRPVAEGGAPRSGRFRMAASRWMSEGYHR